MINNRMQNFIVFMAISFVCFDIYAAPPIFQEIGEERKLNSNIFALEAQEISFEIAAEDPDGDTVTYSAKNIPSWGVFDTSSGSFRGTVPSWADDYDTRRGQPGVYDITFVASDGKYAVKKNVSIYVVDSTWNFKTMKELVEERPISSGGEIGTPVELRNVKDETLWSAYGGGKPIRKITFGFTSQVPEVQDWENDWISETNYLFLPVTPPLINNSGAVIEGGYAQEFGQKELAERACAELDMPVLIIDVDWAFTHGGDVMSKCNEKSIESGNPAYLFYTFSAAHYLRAADAMVTAMAQYTDWPVSYEDFRVVFTGHSKFGNTCFKAAAADPDRVAGFMANGCGNIDSGASRLLGSLQQATSMNPEASPTYLGTMMRFFTENQLIQEQMVSDVQALNILGTDDSKGSPDEYTPKYGLMVTDEQVNIPYKVGTLPNAPHTTQTPQHATYWIMWLAHCFFDRPLSNIHSVDHLWGSDSITVETEISGTPTITQVRVWATNQSDLDFSKWDNFSSYTMSFSNGIYRGEIPIDSTAYFIELLDNADGIAGIITSSPVPTDKNYPLIPRPPEAVSNFLAQENAENIELEWDTPSDHDFEGVIVTWDTEEYSETPLSTKLYDGNTPHTVHTLIQDENIYYSAFTYDSLGNYSAASTTKVCRENSGERAQFDMNTGILYIPGVLVGDESYCVKMEYTDDFCFILTDITFPKCANDDAIVDLGTLILHIPEILVGSQSYRVDMTYLGDFEFIVTNIE